MKVLIADDEPYMIEYIKRLVDWESYGFCQVLTAKGGSMARDLLQKYEPYLLITDIKMPKISGLELSRIIKENHFPTKVIIISGYSEFEYAQQALRYGVSEYLVKPVLKKDFVETLERILEKSIDGQTDGENCTEEVSGIQRDTVSYVKRYIGENYDKNLSLDVLGEIAHLHPGYLSKIFKETTDINLSNYIADIRMQKAAELLERTDLRIHEVMEQVGYQKSQYFSKLFKDKYGMTPKEYRRNKQR